MKISTVVFVALAGVALTACSSHSSKDAMKPAMKDHKMSDTMEKETMMKKEAMMKKGAMMKKEVMTK